MLEHMLEHMLVHMLALNEFKKTDCSSIAFFLQSSFSELTDRRQCRGQLLSSLQYLGEDSQGQTGREVSFEVKRRIMHGKH